MNSSLIKVPDQLTLAKISEFRQKIQDLIDKGNKNFIVDFSNCNFIDSTGLGVLVSVYKKCKDQGGTLKLCSINNPQIYKIFKLTRLDKVFTIYSSYEEAAKDT